MIELGHGPEESRNQRGLFIVFEGLDGAGTSTQLGRLRTWLRKQRYRVESTVEPSHGPLGAVIRLAIEGRTALDPITLALAFAADRMDHLANENSGIQSKLHTGTSILCDRYVLSSLAYQTNRRVEMDWVAELNRFAVTPDVTFFIDTDPDTCIARIEERSSSFELFHHVEELRRVRDNYMTAFEHKQFTGSLVVVDGNRPESAVFSDLLNRFVSDALPKNRETRTGT